MNLLKLNVSFVLILLLTPVLATSTSFLLSKTPALKELVLSGDISLSSKPHASHDYLSTYKKSRTAADLISSVSTHILCTSKFSIGKIMSIATALKTGAGAPAIALNVVSGIQNYAKNPPLGYASNKAAIFEAVTSSAGEVLFSLDAGKHHPESVFVALNRMSEIARDYGSTLYFIDACSTRSKKANTLTQVLALADYISKTIEDLPSQETSNLKPIYTYAQESLSWMRLSSALSFAKIYAPLRYPLLNLESQFASESEYSKLEKKTYEYTLLEVSSQCDTDYFLMLISKAKTLLSKGDYLGLRAQISELSNFECRSDVEFDDADFDSEPFSVKRHFSCLQKGNVEDCNFVVWVVNPNPVSSTQIVELYAGDFGTVDFEGFVVENALYQEVELTAFGSKLVRGSFSRVV